MSDLGGLFADPEHKAAALAAEQLAALQAQRMLIAALIDDVERCRIELGTANLDTVWDSAAALAYATQRGYLQADLTLAGQCLAAALADVNAAISRAAAAG